jgi:hypothetical protein
MERSRATTLRFLARVPEAEILRPRTMSKWSIKDALAHIVAWEEEGTKRLALIAQGRGDRIVFYNDMREADRFNARAVAAARRLTWTALLRRAAHVRQGLIAALEKLPPALLNDPAQEYPVVGWLPEFAWTHEQGHLRRIREWWKEHGAKKRAQ